MRVAHFLVGILFAIAALLQLNDPDPVRWLTLYALAAAACWLSLERPSRWILAAAVGLAALVWAVLLAARVVPTFEWANLVRAKDPRFPAVEETRELSGLVLIAVWMGVRVLTPRRSH